MTVTVVFYFGEGEELIAEMACPPRVGERVALPNGKKGVVFDVRWEFSFGKDRLDKFAGVYLKRDDK